MALSHEQRALLQLLLARGQSYADIASLLDDEESAVRERARGALRELAGADPDAEAPLTDYLLGQADPIDRADAVRALQRSPGARDVAEGLSAQLRLVVPEATLPDLPPAPTGRAAAARPPVAGPPSGAPSPASAPRGWQSVPPGRMRTLIALVAGAALAIAVTVVVVAGDGDDESTGPTSTTSAEAEQQRLARAFEDPIVLRPVDDGPKDATGRVALGTVEQQFGMTIEARNLAPSRGDRYYVPWLYNSRGEALPLADGRKANRRGRLNLVGLIRADLLPILTRFRSIDVSLESRRRPPRHSGRSVLRGKIPGGGQGLSAANPPAGSGGADGGAATTPQP